MIPISTFALGLMVGEPSLELQAFKPVSSGLEARVGLGIDTDRYMSLRAGIGQSLDADAKQELTLAIGLTGRFWWDHAGLPVTQMGLYGSAIYTMHREKFDIVGELGPQVFLLPGGAGLFGGIAQVGVQVPL